MSETAKDCRKNAKTEMIDKEKLIEAFDDLGYVTDTLIVKRLISLCSKYELDEKQLSDEYMKFHCKKKEYEFSLLSLAVFEIEVLESIQTDPNIDNTNMSIPNVVENKNSNQVEDSQQPYDDRELYPSLTYYDLYGEPGYINDFLTETEEEEEKEKNSDKIVQEALENKILNDEEEQGDKIEKKEQEQTQKKPFEVQKPGTKQSSIKHFFSAKSNTKSGATKNVVEVPLKLFDCQHCEFGALSLQALSTHRLYCRQNPSRAQLHPQKAQTNQRLIQFETIKVQNKGNEAEDPTKVTNLASNETSNETSNEASNVKETERYVCYVQFIC